MQVRIECPACGSQHVFDMPEGTIHMTCAKSGKTIEVRLTGGGDAKPRLVEEPAEPPKE